MAGHIVQVVKTVKAGPLRRIDYCVAMAVGVFADQDAARTKPLGRAGNDDLQIFKSDDAVRVVGHDGP